MLKRGFSIVLIITLVLGYLAVPMDKSKAAEPVTLKVGWTAEADSISPFIAYSISATEIFKLIYDPLVAFDNELNAVGRLAKSWQVSDDNLTWTFTLQEGVKWHDGEAFTAEDVKFTYELLQESGLGLYAGSLDGITSIETPDDFTVVIKTDEPKANMLQMTTPILPQHIWKDVKMEELETWPNESPVGTGAFKFVENKAGEYIKLEKNDDYFYKKANVDNLLLILYANTDTMVQSLKIGEIDAAINLGAHHVKMLEKEADFDVVSTATHGFTELSINTWKDAKSKGNPLLKIKEVRQAMSYAIDKEKLINIAYGGQAAAGSTLIPPSLDFWHYKPTDEELRTYDPEQAKELLESAGFTDQDGNGIREDEKGNELNFRFMVRSETSEEVRAGEMIAAMFEEVGIGTKVEAVDDGLLGDRVYDNADFDLFIWGWGTDADPTTILNVMASDQIGSLSDSYYSNEEYDQLLDQQVKIIDLKERQKVVHEMQKILYDEAPYIILLYDNAIQAVNKTKWEGWTKVEGVYFLSFNHENYLDVKPVTAKEEAATDSGKSDAKVNAGEEKEESNSSSAPVILAVIAAAVILMGIIFYRKKKKGISIDDDM